MIVVIGASGFIGSYLVDELVAQKRAVFATGTTDRTADYYRSKGVGFAALNLANPADFQKLPAKADVVILLGALLPANVTDYNPQNYIDINTTGTLNVLEYCRRAGVRKLINASSHSDVAGLWDCGRAIREDDPIQINYKGDHAVYIITKIAGQQLVEHYHQEFGLGGITFRLPAVYGFGPHTEIYIDGKRVVTGFKIFIEKAQAGEPIEVWGDAKKGRDLVYVKDVVGAFIGAADSDKAQGLYNIASGIRTTLEDEVKGVVEVFSPKDHPSKIIYRPDKPNGVHTYLYDISKAKRDLGYQIRYPYIKMLEDYKIEMQGKRFAHLIGREHKS
ncbi:MAG: NAD(P)-dependent oxidoreductase [Phycisphaerae bacterium]|jgi:UDP-glucose 4-epimerase